MPTSDGRLAVSTLQTAGRALGGLMHEQGETKQQAETAEHAANLGQMSEEHGSQGRRGGALAFEGTTGSFQLPTYWKVWRHGEASRPAARCVKDPRGQNASLGGEGRELKMPN